MITDYLSPNQNKNNIIITEYLLPYYIIPYQKNLDKFNNVL